MSDDQKANADSPFHPGERAIHRRLGISEKVERAGRRAIRQFMPDQHREFYAQLPMMFIASVDDDGQPWASILSGAVGFMQSPEPTLLRINALPGAHDPLVKNLRPGAHLGLLGIEPHTRRRNRVNGIVKQLDETGFLLRVVQSFGNCRKYIQARLASFARAPAVASGVQRSDSLTAQMQEIISQADTYYIASANMDHTLPSHQIGVDISHRGGKSGFVRVNDAHNLSAPDFVGNFLFNTLGNLQLYPAAGLLFFDLARGHLLHLAVRAEVLWDDARTPHFTGAQRIWRYQVRHALLLEDALSVQFGEVELSPFVLASGSWQEYEARIVEEE
jgi:predicted pyridoxine 5'-phosphate oxidase superfamily flavin-nucleotide-binding protein